MLDLVAASNGASWPVVLGGVAGAAALAWNIWHAITDRLTRIEVTSIATVVPASEVFVGPDTYRVDVIAANVGRTTETATEVGLGVGVKRSRWRRWYRLDEVTVVDSQRGQRDRQLEALESIAAAVGSNGKNTRPRLRLSDPDRLKSPWPLVPGAAAEGHFLLNPLRSMEREGLWNGAAVELRPFVRLARARYCLGEPTGIDDETFEGMRRAAQEAKERDEAAERRRQEGRASRPKVTIEGILGTRPARPSGSAGAIKGSEADPNAE